MATRRGPDGTVRVSIQGNHSNVNYANVFWCNLTGGLGASQADLDAWLTSFQAAYKTRFAPIIQTSVNFVQAKAVLFQAGGTVLESNVAMTGAGTQGGTELKDNSACKVVSWRTSVYWRGGKPRTYIPSADTANLLDNKSWTAAALTSWTTISNSFRTDVNALVQGGITATQLGFVSFRSGNADRPLPLFFAINGAVMHPRLGSQRRRLGKWQV